MLRQGLNIPFQYEGSEFLHRVVNDLGHGSLPKTAGIYTAVSFFFLKLECINSLRISTFRTRFGLLAYPPRYFEFFFNNSFLTIR